MSIKYKFFFLIFVIGLFFIFYHELFHSKSSEIPSPLINETIPTFKLRNIEKDGIALTNRDFLGHVSMLTFWATWCEACLTENHMLMQIKNSTNIPIYGILYKDKINDAKTWLKQNSNPFTKIGNDDEGSVAIDFGLYGTPETFFIDKNGRVFYKQIGVIQEYTWEHTLRPLILAKQK